MVTSFKRAYTRTVVFSAPDPMAATQPTPPPETHRQVWLSLLWGHCSFLLGPGAHKVLFVPSKRLFPQSCGRSVFKSHWPSKSNSLGVLSPFARSPSWEICWALELSQECKNFFGIIVFQFVGLLLSSSMVELMATSSRRT